MRKRSTPSKTKEPYLIRIFFKIFPIIEKKCVHLITTFTLSTTNTTSFRKEREKKNKTKQRNRESILKQKKFISSNKENVLFKQNIYEKKFFFFIYRQDSNTKNKRLLIFVIRCLHKLFSEVEEKHRKQKREDNYV